MKPETIPTQIWPAPAKLNLMLHITGRREDGYHELQTVFQFIDFSDLLEFKIRGDDQIIRHSENFTVPENEDIIIRAANLLRDKYRQKNEKNPNGCRARWWQFRCCNHTGCIK